MDVSEVPGHSRLWRRAGENETAGIRKLMVLEGRDGSQLVVPLDNGAVASTSLRRFSTATTLPGSVIRRVVATTAGTGALRLLRNRRLVISTAPWEEGAPSLHEYVAGVVSATDVSVAASFGPPRPNRKPVLRVMRPDGTTVAFVKIGWSDLTRALVDNEAVFLTSGTARALSRHMDVPEALHVGEWRGWTALFLSPVATRAGGPSPTAAQFSAVAGALDGDTAEIDAYLVSLRARAGSMGDEPGHRILDGLERWARAPGRADLRAGRWHGDWTPWNMSSAGGRLSLWDWERTTDPGPLGFDVLHYYLQPLLLGGRLPVDKIRERTVERATTTLKELGIPGSSIGALLDLYLMEIVVRHATAPSWPGHQRLMDRLGALLDRTAATH